MGPPSTFGWIDRLREARDAAPATWRLPHGAGLLGLHAATARDPSGAPRVFRDAVSLWEAWWRDELSPHDAVRVVGVTATAGRSLAASLLPRPVRDEASGCAWTRARVERWLRGAAEATHVELAARSAEALERFGDALYAGLGASYGADDLRPPASKPALVREAWARVAKAEAEYFEGVITDGERYNRNVDTWSAAFEAIARDAGEALPGTALEAFVAAHPDGARGRPVAAGVGLIAGRWGTIDERPVVPSFAQGLDAHDMMALARHRRGHELGAKARSVTVAAIFGDLRGAIGGVRVTARDCGTGEGIAVRDEDGTGALVDRLKGRVLARDAVTTAGEVVGRAGATVRSLDAVRWRDVEHAIVRSPWTCRAKEGVCARCYGRSPDDDLEVVEGDAVGLRAAWAIASALRGVPSVWRTWVMGGAARAIDWRASPIEGAVTFDASMFVRGVALRRGRVTVTADDGRAEEVVVCEGDRLEVAQGGRVAAHGVLARFRYVEGCSVAQLAEGERAVVAIDAPPGGLFAVPDPRTGLTCWIVTSQAEEGVTVRLLREGAAAHVVTFACGTNLHVQAGDEVHGGDLLAHPPWRWRRDDEEDSLDVMRGMLDLAPRSFHGRPAVFAPFDAVVTEVSPKGVSLEGLRGERFTLRRGGPCFPVRRDDFVLRGDPLTYGFESLPRLVRARGPREVFERIVRRFAHAAARAGVALADVHAELLARAMLDWRRVRRPGDSGLRRNAVLPRADFERAVEATRARGGVAPEGVTVVRWLGALAGRRWKVSHEERVMARARRRRRR